MMGRWSVHAASSKRNAVRPLDAVLLLHKHGGQPSMRLLDTLRAFRPGKYGHGGTLDPFATGLMMIYCGRATKLAMKGLKACKQYRATIRFGQTTPSLDSETAIIEHTPQHAQTNAQNVPESKEHIQKIANTMIGEYMQIPPMYSAKRQHGKRLYEMARQGITVERKACPVTIHALDVETYNKPDACIHTTVSGGTYVRTLAADLAAKCGTVAYLTALERVAIDQYKLEDAVTLEQLKEIPEEEWKNHPFYISMEELEKK